MIDNRKELKKLYKHELINKILIDNADKKHEYEIKDINLKHDYEIKKLLHEIEILKLEKNNLSEHLKGIYSND